MIDCEDSDRDERVRLPVPPDLGAGIMVHFRAPKPAPPCTREVPLFANQYVAVVTDGWRRHSYAAGHATMPGLALKAAVALWKAATPFLRAVG